MCTTIGFKYKEGQVFGRTLEIGIALDNKILFVPKGYELVETDDQKYSSKYAVLGSGFADYISFGDGINEEGLMGSNNFFPGYASFNDSIVDEKINITMAQAFDYLLSQAKNVSEVKQVATELNVVTKDKNGPSGGNHFFFMDKSGDAVVLEPKDGKLLAYSNPYGVLTNSPDFPWHTTNLKNYVQLRSDNVDAVEFNLTLITKFGEGTGMLGLPGDFTPPSRFIRAAYFVSNTDKNLSRTSALLQGFRILSQFDIPDGAVIDPKHNHMDITLYTSMMDTSSLSYHVKCHDQINIQNFSHSDFENETDVRVLELNKNMQL